MTGAILILIGVMFWGLSFKSIATQTKHNFRLIGSMQIGFGITSILFS